MNSGLGSVRGARIAEMSHSRQRNTQLQRLTDPLVWRYGQLQPTSWEDALDLVARVTAAVIAEQGEDGLFVSAFDHGGAGGGYENTWGTGKLYFQAMKIKNIRIHNRPAYNSEVHGSRDMGVGELNNAYEDAELADTIVAVGTNALETQTTSFVAGPALFGSAYLIPSFAVSVLAFTATDAGQLLLPSGVLFAGSLLAAAFLIQVVRVPPIATVPLGILMIMAAMWMLSGSTADSGSADMMPAILLRGFGLGFLFLSITLIDFGSLDPGRLAAGIGLLAQQPVDAPLHEALLPAPDRGLGDAGLPHDGAGARPCGSEEHDAGPPDVLLRLAAVGQHRLQAEAMLAVTVREMPVRIPQTRTPPPRQESPSALFRPGQSTRDGLLTSRNIACCRDGIATAIWRWRSERSAPAAPPAKLGRKSTWPATHSRGCWPGSTI